MCTKLDQSAMRLRASLNARNRDPAISTSSTLAVLSMTFGGFGPSPAPDPAGVGPATGPAAAAGPATGPAAAAGPAMGAAPPATGAAPLAGPATGSTAAAAVPHVKWTGRGSSCVVWVSAMQSVQAKVHCKWGKKKKCVARRG